jgi:signal transduction histidine kinase
MSPTALTLSAPHPFIRKRTPSPETGRDVRSLPAGAALELAGIAHDARNVVTALKLLAELIGEADVLAESHAHFIEEAHAIADAADHLVKRLTAITRAGSLARERSTTEVPINDLTAAVREVSGLLTAVAGPAIEVQIACLPCAGTLRLTEESLTRILLNLVRNAADAMVTGGRIRITAQRGNGGSFLWALPEATDDICGDFWDETVAGSESRTVVLSVEDDGPGIPANLLERVFEAGFSTRRENRPWPEASHHGLGLSIVRQLVEEAGGTIRTIVPSGRGARFEIELPLTNVTPADTFEPMLGDGSAGR